MRDQKQSSCCGSWVTSVTSKVFALTGYGLGFFSRQRAVACAGAAINLASVSVGYLSAFFEHKEGRAKLNEMKEDFADLVTNPPLDARAAAQTASANITTSRPRQCDLRGYGLVEGGVPSNVLPSVSVLLSWACDIWLMVNACGQDKEELSDNYGPLVLGTMGLLLQWADESLKRANIKQRQEQFHQGIAMIAKAARREPPPVGGLTTAAQQSPPRRGIVALAYM